MDINNLVKERSSNFTANEIEKLKMLIDQHKDVLLCKKTDAVSHNAKELAWNNIHRIFNSNAAVHRSMKQLKYKFDNLKKIARKDASKERQERRRTGGGRPDIPPTSLSTGDWMRSIIVMSTDGMESKYDDDVMEPTAEEPAKALVKDDFNSFVIDQTLHSETVTASTSQTDDVVLGESQELQFAENREQIDISERSDTLPVFDSGAPASLLRCPVSTPLKRPRDRGTVTPQGLRKSFKDLNQKKLCLTEKRQFFLDETNGREEREFQLKLKHMEDIHVQAMRHGQEKHDAEMQILKLKARLLEIEIEKNCK